MWYFSLARFVAGFSFLFVAALMDIKTRRVPNELWIIMGGVASSILAVQLFLLGVPWQYYLIFIPIAVLCGEAFVERPAIYSDGEVNFLVVGWLILPLVTYIYQLNTIGGHRLFWSLTTIPVIILLAFLFYYFRVLYGGADAKAMMVLGILLPFYPQIPGFTHMAGSDMLIYFMEYLFPFTLVVLLNSSLILLALPLSYLFLNIIKRDLDLPQIFFGYRKKVDEIEDSFVWPMEYYEDDEHIFQMIPRMDEEKALKSLRRRDREYAWVTPKLPFILPMCVGFVLSFLIGNPLLYVPTLL